MQGLKSCFPSTSLRPYVRAYAQRWTDLDDAAIYQPALAQTEQVLEFEFGIPIEVIWSDRSSQLCSHVELIGAATRNNPQRYASQIKLPSGVESFAIFFKPAGFSQLFGLPLCETTNHACDASLIAGRCMTGLWNRLGENPAFECRVQIVEEFLRERITRTLAEDNIGSIANYILHRRGTVSMQGLASRSGLGIRQFERTFLRQVGCSPKIFARVARFEAALDAKVASPRRAWLEIAHDFGYHDQMHMIHDFEKLAGNSPQELLALLGDMRPPALASADE